MRASRFIAFAALMVTLAGPAPAWAGWINELGRDLGVGWSDGYHAYEGCPDPLLRSQPWQRRSQRGGYSAEPQMRYLEPAPAPQPAPEKLPPPKSLRTAAPTRGGQLLISRPSY